MHEKVREDPTGSVKKIYEDVRIQVTAGLDQQQKDSLLQEFPKYRNMSANLYKTRQEKIPAAPTEMKDLDVELDWFRFSTGEMVVKGDELFDDGKRILLFSSVAHLELLARAKQILGDGTFKITLRLWTQTFILQAQVCDKVFVPVAFCLLPDKKRRSYDSMFSLISEALKSQRLELSAEYFMSDFEISIRDSFVSHFPDIQAKGCGFHYSKAVIKHVSTSGFKSDYSSSSEFSSFIRAILGLAYIKLSRFREGLRNLYILAQKLKTVRHRKFASKMIKYVLNTWVNGSFPPTTWVMFKPASRKRKSNVSHSVAGANLRRKRRRVQVDDATSQSAASLPM